MNEKPKLIPKNADANKTFVLLLSLLFRLCRRRRQIEKPFGKIYLFQCSIAGVLLKQSLSCFS